jgi:hypothetical protein
MASSLASPRHRRYPERAGPLPSVVAACDEDASRSIFERAGLLVDAIGTAHSCWRDFTGRDRERDLTLPTRKPHFPKCEDAGPALCRSGIVTIKMWPRELSSAGTRRKVVHGHPRSVPRHVPGDRGQRPPGPLSNLCLQQTARGFRVVRECEGAPRSNADRRMSIPMTAHSRCSSSSIEGQTISGCRTVSERTRIRRASCPARRARTCRRPRRLRCTRDRSCSSRCSGRLRRRTRWPSRACCSRSRCSR